MVQDADKYKEADEQFKAKVEARNKLENLTYQMKNTINDPQTKDKIDAGDKTTIERMCNETQKWLDEHGDASTEEYAAKQQEFESLVNPIMAKMYQKSAPQADDPMGGAQAHAQAAGGDDMDLD